MQAVDCADEATMATDQPNEEKRVRLLEEAENARRRFSHSLKALADARIPFHDRAPEIPQHLLDECRLLQSRNELIKLLPKNGVVAEIGTDKGAFARLILDTCRPKQLHLFELDTARIENENISEGLQQGIITIHEGKSASLITSMPDDYFDWMYVDGDHFYEGVKEDIKASASKVKPGGYLVFNDYATWSPSSMSHCGVARAVNEFCIAQEWKMVFFAFQTMMYNDVALRKPMR
jgi:predicted O-methyltransferase YrrM